MQSKSVSKSEKAVLPIHAKRYCQFPPTSEVSGGIAEILVIFSTVIIKKLKLYKI